MKEILILIRTNQLIRAGVLSIGISGIATLFYLWDTWTRNLTKEFQKENNHKLKYRPLKNKLGVPVHFFYYDTHDCIMVYNSLMEFYGAYHSWNSFKKYYRREGEYLNMSAPKV